MLSRAKQKSGYGTRSPQRGRRALITSAMAGLVIVASGAAVACSEGISAPSLPTAVAPAKQPHALGTLTAANVGVYHNAFLDFSFPKVHEAVKKGADHKQACKAIAQAMREFIIAYRIDADPRSVGDDIADSRCRAGGGKEPTFSLATDGTPSPEFDAVVSEMEYAVESGLSAAELSPLFEQKVAYARANLDPAEADVIAAAASVGLSSVEYWSSNYEPQMAELRVAMGIEAYDRIPVNASAQRTPEQALLAPETPRLWRAAAARVGLADLKGAVHGGISGIRGGWQGALAGAAIEGGAKSAGALISELFK